MNSATIMRVSGRIRSSSRQGETPRSDRAFLSPVALILEQLALDQDMIFHPVS